jgi:hypothetical protein
MAGVSVTEVHNSRLMSTAATYLQQKPLDQVFNGNLILGTLLGQESPSNQMTFPLKAKRVKRQTGGRKLRVRVRYNKSTNTTSFNHLDELSTNLDDYSTMAETSWCYYTDLAGRSYTEAVENDGEGLIYDLLEERLDGARDSILETIDTDLMGLGDGASVGNSGKNIIGLNHLLPADPTTGTCLGLNRATYSWWQPNLTTASNTFANAGITNLVLAWVAQSGTSGEDPPTMYITTAAQWRALHAILYAISKIYTLPISKEMEGNAGFQALNFLNRPVVYHASQTAHVWMSLNLNYFIIWLQNKAQFVLKDFDGTAKQLIDKLVRIIFSAQIGCERFDRQSRILFTG